MILRSEWPKHYPKQNRMSIKTIFCLQSSQSKNFENSFVWLGLQGGGGAGGVTYFLLRCVFRWDIRGSIKLKDIHIHQRPTLSLKLQYSIFKLINCHKYIHTGINNKKNLKEKMYISSHWFSRKIWCWLFVSPPPPPPTVTPIFSVWSTVLNRRGWPHWPQMGATRQTIKPASIND